MKLQTPVVDSPCKVEISYRDKIMMIGSCFTDNIGRQLKDFGFDVCINPFGTLYNPASVLSAVKRLISRKPFNEDDCVQIGAGDMRFCSFSHHTSFARVSKEEFLENANQALAEACDFFMSSNKIIITLGTSWCYRHLEKGIIVSNCLKHPASEYRREFIAADQTAAALQEIINLCNTGDMSAIEKEFIFTVSPIRHFKDGAHGNQISKASLLVGIDMILNNNSKADYFPSYEIMMDELRDYRFYAEDMCHPTIQSVNYIRERFLDWALPAEENSILEENIKSYKRSAHLSK